MRAPRLLVRVYLHVAAIFVAAAIAIALVGSYFVQPAFDDSAARFNEWVVEKALEAGDDPAALRSSLEDVHARLGAQITLLDAQGHVVAAAGQPFAPLRGEERDAVERGERVKRPGPRGAMITRVQGRGAIAFALIAAPVPPLDLRGAAVALGLVLLALAAGSLVLVRSLTRPLTELAAATRAFGAGDYTARAKADRADEIGDLAVAFNEMAGQVQRMRLAEKELLANISHELRTPLARIRVVLELAEQEEGSPEQRYFREIAADLAEIERLLDDIIEVARFDLARARAGDPYPRLHIEPARLEVLVAGVVERFREEHPGVNVEVDAPEELPPVACDPALLRRVIANLLANAVQHGQGRDLHVVLRALPRTVEVAVRDGGPGIAETDLPHVFAPFFRADASRSRHTGGFGLGLALCKRIVEAHAGEIALSSREGLGTEVRVVLPA